MADTPSSILLLRLQATGSNVNLWGGYLNTNQQVLEQASKGWQTLTVTGNATISWTNYATGNVGQCAHLVLTGALTSAATLIFPSNMNKISVHNNAGATVTIMCSGGVGVAIPNARKVDLYCTGVDYFSDTPTWTADSTTLTNSGDLVNLLQMSTAIATAGLPATAGTILNSVTDTTAGYLSLKLTNVTNGGIAFSTLNPAANEQRQVAMDINGMSASTNVKAADTFPFYDSTAAAVKSQTRALLVGKFGLIAQASGSTINPAIAGNLYPIDCTAGAGSIVAPASATAGDIWGVVIFGTNGCTFNPNSLNYYGSSATINVNEGITLLYYSGASRGWIDL